MEKNDLDKFIERSDAFDTRKLLEGVDLSNAAEEIDLEEILAEYGKRGHLKDLPEAESDEVWVNEGTAETCPRPGGKSGAQRG